MVTVWSGLEADALRTAMRMSIDDFATRAQVSRRAVANWSRRGARITLRWDMQRALDHLLAQADPEVLARFREALRADDGTDGPDGRLARLHALTAALFATDRPDTVEPSLFRLERAVADVQLALQACDYVLATDRLALLLPRLALTTQRPPSSHLPKLAPSPQTLAPVTQTPPYPHLPRLAPTTQTPLSPRLAKLASEAHSLAARLLLKLGDVALAMLAAQRCEALARETGRPLVIAAAETVTVRVLMRCGQPGHAAGMAARAAEGLCHATGLDGPRVRSGYGALLLRGALAHARAGARAEAMGTLGEAARVALGLDDDANFGWTGFGPADVELHRMGALLALGDAGMALHVGSGLDPERIRLPERRAAFHLTVARACRTLGRHRAAAEAWRQAETVAPQEARLAEPWRQAEPSPRGS